MAQPFAERLKTALTNDRARITDLEALLAEASTERDTQVAIAAQATADSLNLALSDELTDEAATRAARAKRMAASLGEAIENLSAKLEEKRESAARKAEQDIIDALIAERDALAERFRKEWPVHEAAMIELLSLDASLRTRLKAAGMNSTSAEAMARDVGDNGMHNGVPIRMLRDTALPSFDSPTQLAWPKPTLPGEHFDYAAEGRRDRIRARAARDAENARWHRYAVIPPMEHRGEPIVIATRKGPIRMGGQVVEVQMTAEGVEAARAVGCTVETLKVNQYLGGPLSAAVLT